MVKKLLPDETPEDIRAAATIGEADIQAAKQFVAGMTRPARYWIGNELQEPLAATAARRLWVAEEEVN